jgi:hypothetical protein
LQQYKANAKRILTLQRYTYTNYIGFTQKKYMCIKRLSMTLDELMYINKKNTIQYFGLDGGKLIKQKDKALTNQTVDGRDYRLTAKRACRMDVLIMHVRSLSW